MNWLMDRFQIELFCQESIFSFEKIRVVFFEVFIQKSCLPQEHSFQMMDLIFVLRQDINRYGTGYCLKSICIYFNAKIPGQHPPHGLFPMTIIILQELEYHG